jgi:hypothetical protein
MKPASVARPCATRRSFASLLCALCGLFALCTLFAGAALAQGTANAGTGDPDRQILVMLHLPAPHYRPGANAIDSYGDAAGREARRGIAARLAREHGLTPLGDWPMPVLGVDCFVMAVGPNASPQQAAQSLAGDARVAWAQPLHVYRAQRDPLYTLYEMQPAAREWQLAALHRLATGRGVRVAVIDSAVQIDHPELAGAVAASADFVPDRPASAEAHGTGVAGIIAARSDAQVGIVGVAPQARLMALRACWQAAGSTSCTSLSLAQALDFAIRGDAHIVNLSLGGPPDRLLGALIDVALARGITVVAAVDRSVPGGGFPASHRGVVAVEDEAVPGPTAGAIMAPGRDVPTIAPGSRWSVVSGASYAAAHVSGLFALLYELQRSQPASRGPAAAAALVRLPGGRIDTCATLQRAAAEPACSDALASIGPSPRH